LRRGAKQAIWGLGLRWSDDLWGWKKGLMWVTGLEIVRLYLKIGDMVVTILDYYEK